MINWICALLVATTDSCVLVGRKRSFYCYFNVMYKAKGRAKHQELLPWTRFLSCSTCSVTFSTKSSSYSMCRGGLLQTLGLREERWLNQSLAVVTMAFFFPLAISRRNCETTYKRFYLYWTIKLIDFFTVLHGIHMQGKGASKRQSLEKKRNWNWVDSHYAWKKFWKLEISP